MRLTHGASALEPVPRAVAFGSFDGVHAGHRRVVEELRASGRTATVVTFRPHLQAPVTPWQPRLSTIERRLELLAEAGVADVLLLETTDQVEALRAPDRLGAALRSVGAEVVVAADRPEHAEPLSPDLDALSEQGFDIRRVPSVTTSAALVGRVEEGDVAGAARGLGRPFEVEGTVVEGRGRATGIGFATANLDVAPGLACPPGGIYAGFALGHRAGISVGAGPDGEERRVEAHLLDFSGDLYGRRLVVELWQRLREERTYADEHALLAQTAEDLARVRAAVRPA